MAEVDNYNDEFLVSDLTLLLFSHLKLNGIEEIDVKELANVLTNLYYLNETRYVLSCLNLRDTHTHSQILDIDIVLTTAYVLGYLDCNTKKILLTDEYINEDVIPNYDKTINEVFKFIAKYYQDDIKSKELKGNPKRNFIGDLFYKCGFGRTRGKNKNDYDE